MSDFEEVRQTPVPCLSYVYTKTPKNDKMKIMKKLCFPIIVFFIGGVYMSLLKRLAAVAGISVMTAGIMIGSSAPAFAQDTDAGSQNEATADASGVS